MQGKHNRIGYPGVGRIYRVAGMDQYLGILLSTI